MKRKRYLYGLTGFLCLLGFFGVFTEARIFLAFFAFAVDFQYFWVQSDEMLEAAMNRSAALGFYSGMLVTAAVSLGAYLTGGGPANQALLTGFAAGWAAAVVVHALAVTYHSFREAWWSNLDPE